MNFSNTEGICNEELIDYIGSNNRENPRSIKTSRLLYKFSKNFLMHKSKSLKRFNS